MALWNGGIFTTRRRFLFCFCRAVEIDEAGFEVELHPMHLNNRGRTGRGRDEKHVHEPDVLAQLAEQPAPSSRLTGRPTGSCSSTSGSVNGGTKGCSPFFHAMRTAARPVEMMLLRVWGARRRSSKTV